MHDVGHFVSNTLPQFFEHQFQNIQTKIDGSILDQIDMDWVGLHGSSSPIVLMYTRF